MAIYYVVLLKKPDGLDNLNSKNKVVYEDEAEARAVCDKWNEWAGRILPVGYSYFVVEVEHDE